jgi:hypothetical protein
LAFNIVQADTCPLSNPAYKDLRSAANALLLAATSTAACKDFQAKIDNATDSIKNSVDNLTNTVITPGTAASAGTPATPTTVTSNSQTQQNVAVAVSALADLGKITSVYGNSACGKALTSSVDYVDALTSVVNGLTPYFVLYTPAAPYALGSDLVVNSADAFANLYHSSSFNMDDSQQRQAFLDNACAFYNFNNVLIEYIQARQAKETDLDKQVTSLQTDLDAFEKTPVPEAKESSQVAVLDAAFKKDQQSISDIDGMMAKLKDANSFVCAMVRSQISNADAAVVFPDNVEDVYSKLLDDSEKAGRDVSFDQDLLSYLKSISTLDHFPTDPSLAAECGDRAREWIGVSEQLLAGVDRELSLPGRRDLTNTDAAKARKAWEDQDAKKKAALADAKAKQKFLKASQLKVRTSNSQNSWIKLARFATTCFRMMRASSWTSNARARLKLGSSTKGACSSFR